MPKAVDAGTRSKYVPAIMQSVHFGSKLAVSLEAIRVYQEPRVPRGRAADISFLLSEHRYNPGDAGIGEEVPLLQMVIECGCPARPTALDLNSLVGKAASALSERLAAIAKEIGENPMAEAWIIPRPEGGEELDRGPDRPS